MVIGQYYMNGMFGLTRDFKKAIQSFEKVRQANGKEHPLALAYLGKIYLEGGDGVEKNFVKAFDYLNRAINMGSAVARATMGYSALWNVTANLVLPVAHSVGFEKFSIF